ncbi:hypothetical protein SAMN05216244_0869 [Sediminibacillus halophilus]|uniref:Uncharacterized protein n=1 Tax=Sediminibacillus halophilus TaxID=482461 RepID=A0A1G9N659_9BACI|nr:hypothetical protein SAMN05216244_0869 [Sediminibacillus halophilus]
MDVVLTLPGIANNKPQFFKWNCGRAFLMYWRDCVGIEPTGDGTRLPQGFEDPGGHQSPIQPHQSLSPSLTKFIMIFLQVQVQSLSSFYQLTLE